MPEKPGNHHGVILWFGKKPSDRIPTWQTPVGERCHGCGVEIVEDDTGYLVAPWLLDPNSKDYEASIPWHHACYMRHEGIDEHGIKIKKTGKALH